MPMSPSRYVIIITSVTPGIWHLAYKCASICIYVCVRLTVAVNDGKLQFGPRMGRGVGRQGNRGRGQVGKGQGRGKEVR